MILPVLDACRTVRCREGVDGMRRGATHAQMFSVCQSRDFGEHSPKYSSVVLGCDFDVFARQWLKERRQ